ncbi:pyridoxal-phosphate dependent enzyme [Cupriavidus numazuensis]|uniref:pyridoxal-phosphate dependent enzyme n=1 Tax=Cupriavidus numazuensis TaxID=221992 RepID=UPI003618AA61
MSRSRDGIETPLLASPSLSAAAGRTVWLKLESLQPSGSFKLRGIGATCETVHTLGLFFGIAVRRARARCTDVWLVLGVSFLAGAAVSPA